MNADPRYTPVETTLPATLPPLTREEARRAAARLIRHFGRVSMGPATQVRDVPLPSWSPRKCWVSPRATTGHARGWGRVIHDVSHYVFGRRNPEARPHANLHSRLELQMASFVIEKGWLLGSLKPPTPAQPTRDEKRAHELAKIEARIKTWQTKAKRAATVLKKLERRRKVLTKGSA